METSTSLAALLVAVDGGPRDTLQPLAQHWGLEISAEGDWAQRIRVEQPRLVVVGTSDSARGRAAEAAARRAARAANVPVVAIEDFPGNFAFVEDGEAALLVVESTRALQIHQARSASAGTPAEVFPLARYDPYRAQLTQLRHDTAQKWTAADALRVLWAGQPETADSAATLATLAPLLREQRAELIFKAHPRDPGYAAGTYDALLQSAQVPFRDMTHASVHEALALAPRLVLTQFSSVAIEAGFYGIPSLCVLLPEAGGARLQAKKGYAVPIVCAAGAAALVASRPELPAALAYALHDEQHRAALLGCFDGYFDASRRALPALLRRLCDTAFTGR